MKICLSLVSLSMLFTSCLRDGDGLFDNNDQGGAITPTETMIQLYQVVDDKIVPSEKGYAEELWMENPIKHTEMWSLYKSITPSEELRWITEFEIYDGEGEEFGYVTNLNDDLRDWRLGLAIDGAYSDDLNEDGELAHTIIHEYFHVACLNSTQLDPDSENCDYNPQEGCAIIGSYLDEFVDLFWADIINEHEKINPNNQNKLDKFYEKYKDRFVNDYAATNPVEDIAESFTYFVKTEKDSQVNLIRDEKLKHFYNYPELVELREEIRKSGTNLGSASIGRSLMKKKRKCCKK